MRTSFEHNLPKNCDFCNSESKFIIEYYYSGWIKNLFGTIFLCELHENWFKKLGKSEKLEILKGLNYYVE
jgi:hypothetical protein